MMACCWSYGILMPVINAICITSYSSRIKYASDIQALAIAVTHDASGLARSGMHGWTAITASSAFTHTCCMKLTTTQLPSTAGAASGSPRELPDPISPAVQLTFSIEFEQQMHVVLVHKLGAPCVEVLPGNV